MSEFDLKARSYALAEEMLSGPLPRRWRHSMGVARQAKRLLPILGPDGDLLESAAILHDVGYSPSIAIIGFHPLDGARFLRARGGVPEKVIRLVAYHSCAVLEAEERGLKPALESEFSEENSRLVDAMIFCDMTTTPDGAETSVGERLAEIQRRYGPDSIVTRFISRAAPELRAAVERVEKRLAVNERQPM
ncbi:MULTISPECIES: HD domain-containing protein [Protofrankia]|uniref:Metal dependent phophohydrolase n=1 Tax=Candidatus Protofrankia datiscae TaxID=2716812 RepID=F8B480_9ACTN|nr:MULTISPECIES: HD domain-containing protein [Protofrankia]AEH10993.1 metal dependent phophohydrolase [Candidatus Protofrankia datiscae]